MRERGVHGLEDEVVGGVGYERDGAGGVDGGDEGGGTEGRGGGGLGEKLFGEGYDGGDILGGS